MAKKDKKKSKKKDNPGADAVGAVRSAVERTFQATADSAQSTRTRAQDLVDEVASAAVRVREMIEQVGVLEDLKGLRGEVETLARRVAALEGGSKPPASKPASSVARRAQARAEQARRAEAGRAQDRCSQAGRRREDRRPQAGRAQAGGDVVALDRGEARLRRHPQARDAASRPPRSRVLMADPQFDSPKEFRKVIDKIFTMMSEDPDMGPQLKDADTPQRFEFADFDLVVNIRAGEGEEGNLTGSGPTTSTGSPRSG